MNIKGVPKSYFTQYSRLVIIFFTTYLHKSADSTYSFRKLALRLSVFSVCFVLWIHVIFIFGWGNKVGKTY